MQRLFVLFFFFSSRRRHTRFDCDWSSDVCSSDLRSGAVPATERGTLGLFFTESARTAMDTDLTIDARSDRGYRALGQATVATYTYAVALWPGLRVGLTGVVDSAGLRPGSTEVVLFAEDPPAEGPT